MRMAVWHTLRMQRKKTVKDIFVSHKESALCVCVEKYKQRSLNIKYKCLFWRKDFRNQTKKWKIEIDKTHFCDKNMHYICKMVALKQTQEKTKQQQQQQ